MSGTTVGASDLHPPIMHTGPSCAWCSRSESADRPGWDFKGRPIVAYPAIEDTLWRSSDQRYGTCVRVREAAFKAGVRAALNATQRKGSDA